MRDCPHPEIRKEKALKTPENSNIHTLEQLRSLRLAGDQAGALNLATRALSGDSVQPDILAETIRILIWGEKTDMAVQLYQALSANLNSSNNLEPEALVRLAMQMGRADLIENMPAPEKPRWLKSMLEKGKEPAEGLEITEMNVRGENGPSVYFFTGNCPYCSHPSRLRVATNLLTLKRGICPACFGRFSLDFAAIRDFLRNRYTDFLELDVSNTDWDLIDRIRPRVLGDEPAPEVVANLGQEYQFLLNELLARHLMEGNKP
jgi:hypothetical protein